MLWVMLAGAYSLQISPSLGPEDGSTVVQITGEDFIPQSTLACFIGQSPVSSLYLMRAKVLSGLTPSGSGVLPVTCTNDGQSFPFPAASFEYSFTQVLPSAHSYQSAAKYRQQAGFPPC